MDTTTVMYIAGGILLLGVAAFLIWKFSKPKFTNLPSVFGCSGVTSFESMDELAAYEAQFRSDIKWTLTPGQKGANALTAVDASGRRILGPCPVNIKG